MDDQLKAKAIHAWLEAFNAGNMELLDETMAPGYVQHIPPFPDLVGLDAFKEWITNGRRGMPDLQVTVDRVIAEGEWVTYVGTTAGTHTAPRPNLPGPPTGKYAKVMWIAVVRYENGKAVECWDVIDHLGRMQQLGVNPALQPA